ncbi:coproporphyrinogen III oxidase family protein, partial [Ruminococcaceae bacterium OttesenSCG-928-A16]|nr:coproporphyrinogen III oxidase family protein [Ruminococcaceae bacterium OttesenSCG-928-A16]
FVAGSLQPVPDGTCTAEDYIMLQLRLQTGLNTAALKQRFGVELTQKQQKSFAKFCQGGLALQTPQGYTLTTRGLLVQNALLAELLG